MVLSKIISDYIEYLESEQQASRLTIINYDRYLRRFLDFCGDIDHSKIDLDRINRYKLYLLSYTDPKSGKKLKKITVNYFLIALRAFVKYLRTKGLSLLDEEQISLETNEKKKHETLDEESLTSILKCPDVLEDSGLRDKALLELLFSAGLKVSELAALNLEDVDLKRKLVFVGFGGKRRSLFVSDRAVKWLEQYIRSRKDYYKALFIRYQGKIDADGEKMRLTVRSVQRIVEKYAQKAGLKINVTPNLLRRSFGKNLLDKGTEASEVKEILGHKNILTTRSYGRSKIKD